MTNVNLTDFYFIYGSSQKDKKSAECGKKNV